MTRISAVRTGGARGPVSASSVSVSAGVDLARLGQRRGPGGRGGRVGRADHAAVVGGRAADDRSLLEDVLVGDVGHDHRDVVRTATAQRELDEPLGALVRVGVLAHGGRDGLVGHHPGQAVAADQVPVAGHGLADRVLGVGVPPVQRAHEQRLLRVGVRLLGGDPALVDQQLHVGVVPGDLDELAVPQQVGPGVADVHHAELAATEEQAGQRRAHALHGRVGLDRVADLLVGRVDGQPQGVDRGVARHVVVQMGQRADDDVAGDVAGGHAAHAVRDGEQPRARRTRSPGFRAGSGPRSLRAA